MASKPDWINIFKLPDQEVEEHVRKVVAYLKILQNPKIKIVAEECGAPYPRVYHRYNGRMSRYDRERPNRQLSPAQEASLCQTFDLLDNIGLSPRLSLVERSANELLAKGFTGRSITPTVSEMWPSRF